MRSAPNPIIYLSFTLLIITILSGFHVYKHLMYNSYRVCSKIPLCHPNSKVACCSNETCFEYNVANNCLNQTQSCNTLRCMTKENKSDPIYGEQRIAINIHTEKNEEKFNFDDFYSYKRDWGIFRKHDF